MWCGCVAALPHWLGLVVMAGDSCPTGVVQTRCDRHRPVATSILCAHPNNCHNPCNCRCPLPIHCSLANPFHRFVLISIAWSSSATMTFRFMAIHNPSHVQSITHEDHWSCTTTHEHVLPATVSRMTASCLLGKVRFSKLLRAGHVRIQGASLLSGIRRKAKHERLLSWWCCVAC